MACSTNSAPSEMESVLTGMGFPLRRVQTALSITYHLGVEPAMEWLLAHSEELDEKEKLEQNKQESPVAESDEYCVRCTDCKISLRPKDLDEHMKTSGHSTFVDASQKYSPPHLRQSESSDKMNRPIFRRNKKSFEKKLPHTPASSQQNQSSGANANASHKGRGYKSFPGNSSSGPGNARGFNKNFNQGVRNNPSSSFIANVWQELNAQAQLGSAGTATQLALLPSRISDLQKLASNNASAHAKQSSEVGTARNEGAASESSGSFPHQQSQGNPNCVPTAPKEDGTSFVKTDVTEETCSRERNAEPLNCSGILESAHEEETGTASTASNSAQVLRAESASSASPNLQNEVSALPKTQNAVKASSAVSNLVTNDLNKSPSTNSSLRKELNILPTSSNAEHTEPRAMPPDEQPENSESVRIQIKFPDGSTSAKTFKSTDRLILVRDFAEEMSSDLPNNFAFLMNFPRVIFTKKHDDCKIIDLNLGSSVCLYIHDVEREMISDDNNEDFIDQREKEKALKCKEDREKYVAECKMKMEEERLAKQQAMDAFRNDRFYQKLKNPN